MPAAFKTGAEAEELRPGGASRAEALKVNGRAVKGQDHYLYLVILCYQLYWLYLYLNLWRASHRTGYFLSYVLNRFDDKMLFNVCRQHAKLGKQKHNENLYTHVASNQFIKVHFIFSFTEADLYNLLPFQWWKCEPKVDTQKLTIFAAPSRCRRGHGQHHFSELFIRNHPLLSSRFLNRRSILDAVPKEGFKLGYQGSSGLNIITCYL